MRRIVFVQLLLCDLVYADVDFMLLIKNLSNEMVRVESMRSSYSVVKMHKATFNTVILAPNEEAYLNVDSFTPKEKVEQLDVVQIVSGDKITKIAIHPSLLDEPLTSLQQNDLNVSLDYFQYGVGRCITVPKTKPKVTTIGRLFSIIKRCFA